MYRGSLISRSGVKSLSGCVGFCPVSYHSGRVCAFVLEQRRSPDRRLCLRMASLIRSYVTSSVQFTSAFLVMLGRVPARKRGRERDRRVKMN